jgi:prolyl oligopeptidase
MPWIGGSSPWHGASSHLWMSGLASPSQVGLSGPGERPDFLGIHQAALTEICELRDRLAVLPEPQAQSEGLRVADRLLAAAQTACRTGVRALGWSPVQAGTFMDTYGTPGMPSDDRPPSPAVLPPAMSQRFHGLPPAPAVERGPQVRFSDDGLACAIDPYAWIGEAGEAVDTLADTQLDHTRQVFDRIPGYDRLDSEFAEIRRRTPDQITRLCTATDALFYLRQGPADNMPVLCWRQRGDPPGAEQVLLDPARSEGDRAIAYFAPSPDGRTIAVCVGGADENHVIRLIDRESGAFLPDVLPRAWHAEPRWIDNGRLVYRQLPAHPPDMPIAGVRQDSYLACHVVGTPGESDMAVFGKGLRPDIIVPACEAPTPTVAGKYVLANSHRGETRAEQCVYYATSDALAEAAEQGNPALAWRTLCSVENGVRAYAVHGDDAYLVTYRGEDGSKASRYRVIRTSLLEPDPTQAEPILPEQDGAVIVDVHATLDALYIHTSWPDGDQLLRKPFDSTAIERLELPFRGFISEVHAQASDTSLTFTLQSPIESPRLLEVSDHQAAVIDTGLQEPYPDDFSEQLVWEVLWAPSGDVLVPVSVVRRPGACDTTLLQAYAAYAVFPVSHIGREFDPRALHLAAQWGLAAAHVHPRGCGVLGHDWYLAGVGANKPVGWQDVGAAAGTLEEAGVVPPGRLVGELASAGGRLAPAIAPHPDRFAGLILKVAVLDGLAGQTDNPTAIFNVDEYAGTLETADNFRLISAIHPYTRLQPGPHTATLGITGMRDYRVAPSQTLRYVARAQAVSTGPEPILLYTTEGGHGAHTGDLRDALALHTALFALWTGGHPDFQIPQ